MNRSHGTCLRVGTGDRRLDWNADVAQDGAEGITRNGPDSPRRGGRSDTNLAERRQAADAGSDPRSFGKLPAFRQVAPQRNLHCDPAKRSLAVKGGPTGPSAASREAAPLTGRRSEATEGGPPRLRAVSSPTIIHGEPKNAAQRRSYS